MSAAAGMTSNEIARALGGLEATLTRLAGEMGQPWRGNEGRRYATAEALRDEARLVHQVAGALFGVQPPLKPSCRVCHEQSDAMLTVAQETVCLPCFMRLLAQAVASEMATTRELGLYPQARMRAAEALQSAEE